MISIQAFQPLSRSLLRSVMTLRQNVKDWIRQEIVDDDPYDQEVSLVQWMDENNQQP